MKSGQGPIISLRSFGEDTEVYEYDHHQAWVAEMLERDLKDLRRPGAPAKLTAELSREGRNFLLRGKMELELQPLCDRCAKEFETTSTQDFSILLIPPEAQVKFHTDSGRKKPNKEKREKDGLKESRRESPRPRDGDDEGPEWGIEDESLVYEDVGSSILKAEEVDLAVYFHEQALLSRPMTLVCKPECPGLCLRCGADLSAGGCTCEPEPTDQRWQALKGLKLKH